MVGPARANPIPPNGSGSAKARQFFVEDRLLDLGRALAPVLLGP